MRTWAEVEAELARRPRGTWLGLSKLALPPPAIAGASRSLGLNAGQRADWRFPPTVSCQGLHVHEHDEHYVAHLDAVHPACAPLGHLVADAPLVALCGVLGAITGAACRGALGGAAGLLAGAALGAGLSRRSPTCSCYGACSRVY